mmetsp:Transcript_2716/g.3722  ORF Transcript_2716/g.3722 Transcript_2716/m.3722 type:complete len:387 (-) Transcript_2716:826-1986(-)
MTQKVAKEDTRQQERPAPSIPSKIPPRSKTYEEEKAGFGSSTHRFRDKSDSISAGPGCYHNSTNRSNKTNHRGSFSARGFTPLVSRTCRFSDLKELHDASHPGPGAYSPVLNATQSFAPSCNFAPHCRQNQATANAKKCSFKNIFPGPGQYNVQNKRCRDILYEKAGTSSFKSTSRKAQKPKEDEKRVAVGAYRVGESMDYLQKMGKLPRKGKPFPDPTFSSKLSRIHGVSYSTNCCAAPGPGYYFPQPNSEIFDYERPSSVFNTSLDRFGETVDTKVIRDDTPGPGEYEPRSQFWNGGAVASFRSSSQRFDGAYFAQSKPPGPGMSYRSRKRCADCIMKSVFKGFRTDILLMNDNSLNIFCLSSLLIGSILQSKEHLTEVVSAKP